MSQKERRRFPRYEAPDSLVATAKFPPDEEHRIRVTYISIDGLSFVTEANISGEAFFTLTLEMEGEGGHSVRLVTPAKIVWRTFDKQTSRSHAGVQFLGLKDEDKNRLWELLSSLTPQDPQ